MDKEKCLQWAIALITGTHKKHRGKMSNLDSDRVFERDKPPSSMCCLCVANETFKSPGYKKDRRANIPYSLQESGVLISPNPFIYGLRFSDINDGIGHYNTLGIPKRGMTHREIGMLLLFAIESGEYKNI